MSRELLLDVTGLGAVTAVGLNAMQTAACVRAKVCGYTTRQTLAPPEPETRCAPVPAAPRLKYDAARWLQHLAIRALSECLGPTATAQPLALLLSIPERYRCHPAFPDGDPSSFVACLRARLPASLVARVDVFDTGHASAFQALDTARELLTRGNVAACLIGGVDSLLNDTDLERLKSAARLHGPDNPQGIIPGEAAVFLRFEPSARGPQIQPLARLLGVATGVEANHALSEQFSTGEGLRDAIDKVLAMTESAVGIGEPLISQRFSDMNGERYRAIEGMLASQRAYRTRREHFEVCMPATSTGDVGAAAGYLSLLCAAMALFRGYAAGPAVICEGASDEGLRGACVLAPATGAPRPPFLSRHPVGAATLKHLSISAQ